MDKGYGTLPVLGVRYQRGTGAIRLLYCGITALAISVIRIVCDLAIALTLAHHSAKDFIFASSIDLLLALGAAWAAYAALSYRRWGVIAFAVVSFIETALYSVAYLVITVLEVRRAWRSCGEPDACDLRAAELSDHGTLLIILGVHLSLPTAMLQFLCAYFASLIPEH